MGIFVVEMKKRIKSVMIVVMATILSTDLASWWLCARWGSSGCLGAKERLHQPRIMESSQNNKNLLSSLLTRFATPF